MDGNIIEFSTYNHEFHKEAARAYEYTEKNMLTMHIRFNTHLDAKSINKQTACISDCNGNIINASIYYNKKNRTIIAKTAKPYLENKFYYLNLTKSIKSLSGRSLSESVQIKFKIANNKVTEYAITKGKGVIHPALGGRKKTTQDVYRTFISNATSINKLPFSRQYAEILVTILSLLTTIIAFINESHTLVMWGSILFILVIIKITKKIFTNKSKSKEKYNIGVKKFNKTNYEDSITYFEAALTIDSNNILAQRAIDIAYEKLIDSFLR